MEIKPVAKIKNFPNVDVYSTLEAMKGFLEENGWTHATVKEFTKDNFHIELTVDHEGKEAVFMCENIEKLRFALPMEEEEVKIKVSQRKEGIRVKAGTIRIVAKHVQLMVRR